MMTSLAIVEFAERARSRVPNERVGLAVVLDDAKRPPHALQPSFGPPKSDRGRREDRIDRVTVAALGEQQAAQLVERALAGDAWLHRPRLIVSD